MASPLILLALLYPASLGNPLLLANDATALPAVGMVETTKETFGGSARGDLVVIRSDLAGGTECKASIEGRWISCVDGRQGHLTWIPSPLGARAYGTLGGEPFTLVVG